MNIKALLLSISVFVSINSLTFAMEGSASSSGGETLNEQEEMSLLDQLPIEVLSNIFDYLPLNEQTDSRTLSQRINEAICANTQLGERLKLKTKKGNFCRKAGKPAILESLSGRRIQYLSKIANQLIKLPLRVIDKPSFSKDKRARILLNAYYFLIKHGPQDKRLILGYKRKFHNIYLSAPDNIQRAFESLDRELNFLSGNVKNLKNQLKEE